MLRDRVQAWSEGIAESVADHLGAELKETVLTFQAPSSLEMWPVPWRV